MKTDHPQVPFTTLYGEQVEVDEDLLEILDMLKRRGVVTLASCQDNHGQGYISALRPGMKRFLKDMLSIYNLAVYSEEVYEFVNSFSCGYKATEFSIFLRKGTYRLWSFVSTKGKYVPTGYQIEHYFRNDKLPSMVIRWPHNQHEIFLKMLQEIRA